MSFPRVLNRNENVMGAAGGLKSGLKPAISQKRWLYLFGALMHIFTCYKSACIRLGQYAGRPSLIQADL